MRTNKAAWSLLLMLVSAGTANADRLAGPEGRYSFDLPAGWSQLPQEGYTLEGPNNETFVEMAAPKGARSIGELSRATILVAPALGFDEPGKDDVTLAGPGWTGAVTFLRGEYGSKKVKSTLMVFVVRGPRGFRTFWLVASDKMFAEHEAEYMALFKTLEFTATPAPQPAPPPSEPVSPAPPTAN
jgi:hypothetical protein